MKNILKNNGTKTMLAVFFTAIISRLLMFAVSLIVFRTIDAQKSLYDIFSVSGDVPHYLHIAEHWYQSTGDKANLIVFYPLFPMLIALFRVVFRDYLLSGIIISYISFGIASCYFYKLLRLDFDHERTADAMLAMFMGIFGIFYISAHTESVFIMLTVMTLYYMREKKWLLTGILGFLASLSRTQGVILFIPIVYEIVLDIIKNKKFNIKYLFSLLVPFGYICYLLLNKAVTGEFFTFMEYQAAKPWYNEAKWIADSLSTSYSVGERNFALSLIIYWPQIIMFFISVISIFVGAYKKVNTSYLLFIGAYTGVTYFHGWMLSGGRYLTACIPLYIVFTSIDNKYVKNSILLLEGLMFIVIAVMWLKGYAIM